MCFTTERDLVNIAIQYLPVRQWLNAAEDTPLFQGTEIQGLFGIPDLIAAVPSETERPVRSIAFEMKLSDWRRGLMQAFRYRSFASHAFLVIDDSRSGPAVANVERFRRANVGLIGLRWDGNYSVYVWPEKEAPFAPHLEAALVQIVNRVQQLEIVFDQVGRSAIN